MWSRKQEHNINANYRFHILFQNEGIPLVVA